MKEGGRDGSHTVLVPQLPSPLNSAPDLSPAKLSPSNHSEDGA